MDGKKPICIHDSEKYGIYLAKDKTEMGIYFSKETDEYDFHSEYFVEFFVQRLEG